MENNDPLGQSKLVGEAAPLRKGPFSRLPHDYYFPSLAATEESAVISLEYLPFK
jgi:hypothetical protein